MKSTNSTLYRYFAGLTEFAFQAQLGIVDPPLVDYVSGLLVRFVRIDALHKIRNLSGRPMTEVAEMIIEAAVWGMLPKNSLGRRLIRHLKVYAGPNHPHQAQQPEILELVATVGS